MAAPGAKRIIKSPAGSRRRPHRPRQRCAPGRTASGTARGWPRRTRRSAAPLSRRQPRHGHAPGVLHLPAGVERQAGQIAHGHPVGLGADRAADARPDAARRVVGARGRRHNPQRRVDQPDPTYGVRGGAGVERLPPYGSLAPHAAAAPAQASHGCVSQVMVACALLVSSPSPLVVR